MTTSQARIDAALRLAEALDKADEHNHADSRPLNLGPNVKAKLSAYRATLPKLRTRAEVDAEIVRVTREHCGKRAPGEHLPSEALWKERCFRLIELCREPTAPEADD